MGNLQSIIEKQRIGNCRLGEIGINKNGETMFIVEYNNANDIAVIFKNSGELVKCRYKTFKDGEIKSHFTPSVYGVGITGLENTKGKDGNSLKSYICWHHMIQRCYSNKQQEKQPSYIGCKVDENWLYYSNFKAWYDSNYYEIDGQKKVSQLDKDILIKGNKIYSPKTCVFVPQFINKLFVKCDSARGLLPIGVCHHKPTGKYQVNYRDKNEKQTYIGLFNMVEDAFNAYKEYKEQFIKETANKYKEHIPINLYNAMMKYEVNIND